MVYPKNIEEKLGFDKIRELLKEQCQSDLGKRLVEKMRFSTKYEIIQKWLSQTDEFLQILQRKESYPSSSVFDFSESLRKAAVLNNWLEPEELDCLLRTLQTLDAILTFFQKQPPERYPALREVIGKIDFEKKLIVEISRVIDERGQIRNDASSALLQIRKQLVHQELVLSHRLEELLKDYKKQGFTKEDAEITIREGRLVVPINAEHKRSIKGLIHDTSNSGQTIFIEPEAVVFLNNEVRELQIAEKQEIIKILTLLTDKIRPHIESLERANELLGVLDFIGAKARLAFILNACKPNFVDKPYVEWYEAYHPLLLYHFSKQGRKVVPQTILLNQQQRILVISGPNAGGKSVCLKTVGLLQYMLQCGLLIPMKSSSVVGLFENIFLDIGDDQSLDDDLSTYSSHLQNMKFFLAHANSKTLILIDEFGSGTEPSLGGAIAESILEQLNRQKAFGVITTHYANLKYFAHHTEGVLNGAMRYDMQHLTPLYELELGQPGSSFALEIAQKIGLPKSILQKARKKVGDDYISIEQLLKELEIEKRTFSLRNQELEKKIQENQQTYAKYKALKEELEAKQKEILNRAKAEARVLLQGTNRKIERIIREIRESQANKETVKQLREELADFGKLIGNPEPIRALEPEEKIEVTGGELEIGCDVQVKDTGAIGVVAEIHKKDVVVLFGEIKSTIKADRLVRISKKEAKKNTTPSELSSLNIRSHKGGNVDLYQRQTEFSPILDIRGKRAEEVLGLLDNFINEALMLGHHQLKIIHGKGNGILREVVRKHLRNYPEVQAMTDEHENQGENGVTFVKLSS
ncbi:MAG: endonuclease MutS2 [Cytophagales bacterium]|nr:endonuclease MutS2 [Cytophagales bacterium]MDW8384782.1 endonuclease MutS2 [Flammeovirgaceae bacterium]